MTQYDADNAAQTADRVVRRERRRIRILAGITIGLWIVAILVIPGLYMPMAAYVRQGWSELINRPADAAPLTAPDAAATVAPMLAVSVKAGGMMVAVALLIEILAAISTVMLALTIRRVTLRQVTDGLADISAQLRQLRGGAA